MNPTLFGVLLFIDLAIIYFIIQYIFLNVIKNIQRKPDPKKIKTVVECLKKEVL